MSIIWWTDEEIQLLKEIYPKLEKQKLLKQLKNKTWYAIKKKADELNLKRDDKLKQRQKKPPKQFLGEKQLRNLLEKDLTIEEIAKKLRSEPHIVRRFIQKYGL
jgi:hypothetical protein